MQKYKFIKTGNEKIWEKELNYILQRDIHSESLGCCVKDTHMKIGDIHLGTFFEAQFLFSNAYWISIFSNALKETIINENIDKSKSILVIGYETYIEPVVLQTKDLLKESQYNVDYCIYEEPKYILHNKKSGVRIRICSDKHINEYDLLIFVCGISSTLSTFSQMINKVNSEMDGSNSLVDNNCYCYSIIQVLPEELLYKNEGSYCIDGQEDTLDLNKDTIERKKLLIKSKYLTKVHCEWQNAKTCKWCFDSTVERPLVSTNETSVIPVQMIGRPKRKTVDSILTAKIDFFKRDENQRFIYTDYLYYNHIERSTHHYQYYIRTNSLIKKITETEDNIILEEFCKNVKDALIKNNKEKRIDVIVIPTHYSNGRFGNIVSKNIFGSRCEIINVNPKKEFRSNFETKYSNYAYIFDAVNDEKTNVYFHYVDDQLITGSSYYRAKSFITSLLQYSETAYAQYKNGRIKLFESVIIMLNRNSGSSKWSYAEQKFFSLIDISVPFMRNYGDSCYLCAKTTEAEEIKKKTAYVSMEEYWEEKQIYHRVKNLETVKKLKKELPEKIVERKFRSFYCENLLWSKLKNNWLGSSDIYNTILDIIANDIKNYNFTMQYEYIISFIKILSRPFLYYRENIKKAILPIMLYMIHILNYECDIKPRSMLLILKEIGKIEIKTHNDAYVFIDNCIINSNMKTMKYNEEKYYLYIILLANLCYINSAYLIKSENIIKALDFYNKIVKRGVIVKSEQELENDESNSKCIIDISTHISRYIKNLTNGTAGNYRAIRLDRELNNKCLLENAPELVKKLYLENVEAEEMETLPKFDSTESESLKQKYRDVLNKIIGDYSSYLIVLLSNDRYYYLSRPVVFNETKEKDIEKLIKKNLNEEIIIDSDYFAIKCCKQYTSDIKTVYLAVSYQNDNMFEKYKYIRSILRYRYDIGELLDKDIRSGSIRDLDRDDTIMDTLSQPKVISHGQSEDIKEHLCLLEQLYNLYRVDDNTEMFNIYSAITLFSNLLISYYHLKKVSKETGNEYKLKESLNITYFNYYIPMHNISISKGTGFDESPDLQVQKLIKTSLGGTEDFFQKFEYYINCLKRVDYNIETKGFIELKSRDNLGIICPTISNYKSIWFSIALIHIFIKNAQKHGTADKIIVEFKVNQDNNIDLIVSNTKSDQDFPSKYGITKQALECAFEDAPNNVSIDFNPQGDNNKFLVIITNYFINKGEQ